MFSKILLITTTSFILTNVLRARAQEATATIVADFTDGSDEFAFDGIGSLLGGIAGTGADGTTFVISNQPTTSTQPTMTATVVADSTHISAYYAGGQGSLSTMKIVQCDLDGDNAVCTNIVQIVQSGFQTAVTLTTTATVSRTAIPVSSIAIDAASATPGLLISGDRVGKSLGLIALSSGVAICSMALVFF